MWTPVKGWETEPEQFLLATMAKLLHPLTILEIGSEHGMSASIWVQYAPNAKIYCVEINPQADFLDNINAANLYTGRIEWLLGDSQQVNVPKQVIEQGIDILFVDGDHSYEAAKADLVRWSKYVNTSGAILVHDCACSTNKMPHEQHYAVYSAVQNFIQETQQWRVFFCVDTTMVLVRV